MATKRIRWTDEEVATVAQVMAEKRITFPFPSWSTALVEANKSLPPERRKSPDSLKGQTLVKMKSLAEMLRAGAKVKREKEKDPEIVSGTEEVGLEDLLENVVDLLIEQLKPTLRTMLVSKLAKEAEVVLVEAKREVALQFGFAEPEQKPVYLVPAEVKKKVLVVGLIGAQISTILNKYGDVYDVRFHQSTENLTLVKSRVKNVDYVILNTTKISHPLYEIVKETIRGGKTTELIPTNGGVTAVELAFKSIEQGATAK